MSNPKAIFFDTGPLIALFNVNKSEKNLADKILEHMEEHPNASRHIVGPSLVELFFKLRKAQVKPINVRKNLDFLGITVMPISYENDQDIFNQYCEYDYCVDFDYADFYLCKAAFQCKSASILTIDNRDIGNALAKAYSSQSGKNISEIKLVPFAK